MRFGKPFCAAITSVLVLAAAPALAADPPAPPPSAASPAASPRALELTRRYFAAMHMESTMKATMKAVMPAMVEQLARNNPKVTKEERAAIVEVAAQSSQTMIAKMMDRMAPVFAQSFSEKELQDLVDFYEGPTGQALVAKTPAFAAKMNPTMAQLMPEMMADMQARLCAKLACTTKASSTGGVPKAS